MENRTRPAPEARAACVAVVAPLPAPMPIDVLVAALEVIADMGGEAGEVARQALARAAEATALSAAPQEAPRA
jgi:hypothetical protein